MIATALVAVGSPWGPPATAVAQETAPAAEPRGAFTASAYLPLGHWAYPILAYWIAAGRISDLSPIVKPYRRMDVARAVARLSGGPIESGWEADWLSRLQSEFASELGSLARRTPTEPAADAAVGSGDDAPGALMIYGTLGATYRTQTHRDPLRPELGGTFAADRLLERVMLETEGHIAILAGAFRAGRDGIFLNDAQFPDGRVVAEKRMPVLDELGVRVEEAYLELQTRYARVGFGRMYHDWGLPGIDGLMRSGYAYSEEEISYRFGTALINLSGAIAPFADFAADTARYFSIHQLEIRPSDDFMVTLSESVIHGGPGQSIVFSYINPVGIWSIARGDDDPPRNAVGGLDLWWRAIDGLTLFGSLLADATNSPTSSNSCCQLGGSLGFELAGLLPGWLFRANGSALQSLVYRTTSPWEIYAVEGIGLGWDKSDIYLATLEAEWFGPAGLRLSPRLDLQWRGEGDFRVPPPSQTELPGFPRILVGTTETTVRPAVAGSWRTPLGKAWIDLEWDLGLNIISNYRHAERDDRTELVATVRAVVETPRWLIPLGG